MPVFRRRKFPKKASNETRLARALGKGSPQDSRRRVKHLQSQVSGEFGPKGAAEHLAWELSTNALEQQEQVNAVRAAGK